MTKVASESLSALRTVQAYNAHEQERIKFHERIGHVLSLAKKEATASAIFFGSTGWSGNVTLLSLLGYGSVIPRLGSLCSNTLIPGGTLVSQGQISVGDLTSLLLYTVYVGNGVSGGRIFHLDTHRTYILTITHAAVHAHVRVLLCASGRFLNVTHQLLFRASKLRFPFPVV